MVVIFGWFGIWCIVSFVCFIFKVIFCIGGGIFFDLLVVELLEIFVIFILNVWYKELIVFL